MTAHSSRLFAARFSTRLQPVCRQFQHQSPPLCRLTATKIAAESPPSRPHFAAQPALVPALLLPVSPQNCSRIAARLQPVCHQTSTSPGPLCRLSATKSASFRSLIDPYFAAVLRPSAPQFPTRMPPPLPPTRSPNRGQIAAWSPLFCCCFAGCQPPVSDPYSVRLPPFQRLLGQCVAAIMPPISRPIAA
jgi:hypothetical protein